jgi:arabinogalactan endo-1,4-beta-galactosidase
MIKFQIRKQFFLKGFNLLLIFFALLTACNKTNNEPIEPIVDNNVEEKVFGADISGLPQILEAAPTFYNFDDSRVDFLDLLKQNGINTIRLRLWVNPISKYSSFSEVKQFSNSLKANGFKTWITVHYSDTWADPGHQSLPIHWQHLNFESLKDSVQVYTTKIIKEMQPNYIQIGNEINSGFMHPMGNITSNFDQFKDLLEGAILAVRTQNTSTKIILHYAGIQGAKEFYSRLSNIDYDIIGISFYPIWHGKSLSNLELSLNELGTVFNKKILIAETAYPFTLNWADNTHNIVGLESQLILPNYPATPLGQQNFIQEINKISTKNIKNGIGFCYWGAELIATDQTSTNGSPWENQALVDFNLKALPVLKSFKQN